jgi:antitoxin FitA
MTTLTISLPEEQLAKLQQMAAQFSITPEELARVGVEELLSQPEETFERAANYVLLKNAELLRRLA